MSASGRGLIRSALIIFARLPQPGRAKTRLAAALGDDFAADFYRRCAEHVLHQTAPLAPTTARYLFHDVAKDAATIRRWLGPYLHYVAQTEGDLGQRMASAFHHVFAAGANSALIIGTDIPDISTDILAAAYAALNSYDVVIGPAGDGGYYLLGINELYVELFKDIAWSTRRVLVQTLSVTEKLGLSVHRLPMLMDIDTAADLRRWALATSTMPASLRELLNTLPPGILPQPRSG